MKQTIYIELLDEGVEVWAPVEAERFDDGSYRLPASAPDDERWVYRPGSRVLCEPRGDHLVVVGYADDNGGRRLPTLGSTDKMAIPQSMSTPTTAM